MLSQILDLGDQDPSTGYMGVVTSGMKMPVEEYLEKNIYKIIPDVFEYTNDNGTIINTPIIEDVYVQFNISNKINHIDGRELYKFMMTYPEYKVVLYHTDKIKKDYDLLEEIVYICKNVIWLDDIHLFSELKHSFFYHVIDFNQTQYFDDIRLRAMQTKSGKPFELEYKKLYKDDISYCRKLVDLFKE